MCASRAVHAAAATPARRPPSPSSRRQPGPPRLWCLLRLLRSNVRVVCGCVASLTLHVAVRRTCALSVHAHCHRATQGLEGAIVLGYKKELEGARAKGGAKAEKELFDELLDKAYARGKALNNAVLGELDAVIDPAATREWLIAGLEANPAPAGKRTEKKRRNVSTW